MKLTKIDALKHCISLGLIGLGLAFGGCGGGSDTQTVSPASSGKRGETCLSRNDCASGLACIGNVCSKNDFPTITANLKECVPVECEETVDCCGERPEAKCNAAETVCYTPTLDTCYASAGYLGGTCGSAADCGGGTCVLDSGTCTGGLDNGFSCTSKADCDEDVCDTTLTTPTCTYSGITCTVNTDCTYFTSYGTSACTPAAEGSCNCTNPLYDPSDAICTDPDCEEPVCTLECNSDKMCVEKGIDCEVNLDCSGLLSTPVCADDGRCVACVDDEDCPSSEFKCTAENTCEKPCKYDEECPFLQECDTDNGECKEVGCKTDVQCVYWFSQGAGPGSVVDAREAKCVTVEGENHKQCRIPCEVDAECGEQSVCSADGVCTFIGCKNNDECRAAYEPNQQETTEEHPYVTHWECTAAAE